MQIKQKRLQHAFMTKEKIKLNYTLAFATSQKKEEAKIELLGW